MANVLDYFATPGRPTNAWSATVATSRCCSPLCSDITAYRREHAVVLAATSCPITMKITGSASIGILNRARARAGCGG